MSTIKLTTDRGLSLTRRELATIALENTAAFKAVKAHVKAKAEVSTRKGWANMAKAMSKSTDAARAWLTAMATEGAEERAKAWADYRTFTTDVPKAPKARKAKASKANVTELAEAYARGDLDMDAYIAAVKAAK